MDTLYSIINDLLKTQGRNGFSTSHLSPTSVHPLGDTESVYSRSTTTSILSTATPFCVFNDDDNNTVVSYKVVHQPVALIPTYSRKNMYNKPSPMAYASPSTLVGQCYHQKQYEKCCCDDSYSEMKTNSSVSTHDITLHSMKLSSDSESWSVNWNEMNDDDTIASSDTILASKLSPQNEIVFVRSKKGTQVTRSQGELTTLNNLTSNATLCTRDPDDEQYDFPWNAYKDSIKVQTKPYRRCRYTKSLYSNNNVCTMLEL
jgi:hypothetical protein